MALVLRTPKHRVAFPNVFEPKAQSADQTPKYSLLMIFDKAAQQTPEYKALVKEIEAVAKERWPKGLPKGFKNPIKKAVDMVSSKGDRYTGFEDDDTIGIRAQSSYAPGVLDRNKQPISKDDKKGFYAGAYAIATVSPAAFDQPTNKGVTIYLNNIIKVAEGDSLGGRRDATQEFKDLEIEIEEISDSDFGLD